VDCSHSNIEKLVIVVHGVGDPDPGATLSKFARSIVDETRPLKEQQSVVWLAEKSTESKFVKTFAVHNRQIECEGQQIQLAEVFWGDLSRVRKGLLGAAQGIFQILFGLRYVAYVAADQEGVSAHWLKRLGLISSRILHGPVLGVTFFMAILTGAVLCTQLMWADSYKGVLWTQVVLAACCCVALVTAGIGWKLTHSRVLERFWFWVTVTSVFVAGLMIMKSILIDVMYPDLAFTGTIRPGLIWYCRILAVLCGFLWLVEIVVLSLMAYCWLMSALHPRTYAPAIHVAFLLPALAVGIWGQALPMIWLSARQGINSIATLPDFSAVFAEATPLLGVQFMMMIVIAVVAMVVVLRFFTWKAKISLDSYSDANVGPRLIVHSSLQIAVAGCTAVGAAAVLILGIIQMAGVAHDKFWFGNLMTEFNRYAIMCLVPLAGIMALLIPHLRSGFDILLDVVNHFYFRDTSIQDALDDEDEFDINETTFESGTLFFSRRDAILSRFKRILAHYRDELPNRPELVIVSHSQGTMIAVESLNDPDLGWLGNCFSSVTLVTMGSPLKHLYQHYFQHFYPRLNQPFWSQLRKRTDRWVNIYRIDDYVGREIDFPEAFQTPHFERCADAGKIQYANFMVGPRGHQGYWEDVEVLDILRQEVFSRSQATGDSKAA
jgi:hypothetical protein